MVSAANSAKAILAGRDIRRVVVVDDDVGQPPWYGLVDLLDLEDKASIGQRTEFDLLNTDWRGQLDLATFDVRSHVEAEVNTVVSDRGIQRPSRGAGDAALNALRKILSSQDLRLLNPSQWQADADDLVKQAESVPTLFLIDQRLGDGREGAQFVQSLLAKGSKGCFVCILTADTRIDNEFDYWRKLRSKYEFQPGQVGIVAKGHLAGDGIGFARMLKISLTAKEVEEVRTGVLNAARDGMKAGLERFSELDLPTLTSIVFESSRAEGAWEVETILRVVKAFVGEALDNRVYGDQNVTDSVKEIAAAASVNTGMDERLMRSAFKIQHAERYVTGNYLSERQLALANGDILEVTSAEKASHLWVLVAQPCDLAIRPNGKRNGSPTHLTILPLESGPSVPRGAYVELLHYRQPDSERVFVRLTKPAFVPTEILDLAAFSTTGEAAWMRYGETQAMRVAPWNACVDRISKKFRGILNGASCSDEELDRRVRELRLPDADHPEIRPIVDAEAVRYPIKRVGRLRERQAETVLQAFGLALSRTAEVHDLARINS